MSADHAALAMEIQNQKQNAEIARATGKFGGLGALLVIGFALFSAVLAPFSLAFVPLFWGLGALYEIVALPEGWGIAQFFLRALIVIAMLFAYVTVPLSLASITRFVLRELRRGLNLSGMAGFLLFLVEWSVLGAANFFTNLHYIIPNIVEFFGLDPWSPKTLIQVAGVVCLMFLLFYALMPNVFADEADQGQSE